MPRQARGRGDRLHPVGLPSAAWNGAPARLPVVVGGESRAQEPARRVRRGDDGRRLDGQLLVPLPPQLRGDHVQDAGLEPLTS